MTEQKKPYCKWSMMVTVLKLNQDRIQCFENGPMPCQCADDVIFIVAVYKFEISRVYMPDDCSHVHEKYLKEKLSPRSTTKGV